MLKVSIKFCQKSKCFCNNTLEKILIEKKYPSGSIFKNCIIIIFLNVYKKKGIIAMWKNDNFENNNNILKKSFVQKNLIYTLC